MQAQTIKACELATGDLIELPGDPPYSAEVVQTYEIMQGGLPETVEVILEARDITGQYLTVSLSGSPPTATLLGA
jgi:hypothetical protein